MSRPTGLLAVLMHLYPEGGWSLVGDSYDGLIWQQDGPMPSEAVLSAAQADADAAMGWREVRAERDRLLAGSDWTQVADAPVDQQAWAVYRQTLRDIPQDFASPDEVVWPEQP